MLIDKLNSWWRRLPQKTRVQLIATVLLVLAGTEVLVLAPYVVDIAVMIDVGGLALVLAALRSSLGVSLVQLHTVLSVVLRPWYLLQRVGESAAGCGLELSEQWYYRFPKLDLIARRCYEAVLVFALGVELTRALIVFL